MGGAEGGVKTSAMRAQLSGPIEPEPLTVPALRTDAVAHSSRGPQWGERTETDHDRSCNDRLTAGSELNRQKHWIGMQTSVAIQPRLGHGHTAGPPNPAMARPVPAAPGSTVDDRGGGAGWCTWNSTVQYWHVGYV